MQIRRENVNYKPREWRTAASVVPLAEDMSTFKGYGSWGPWHLDEDLLVLWTEAGGYRYEIDLEECLSSAHVLDWICQIAGKTWGGGEDAHDRIVGGLVNAFIGVLHPQANLCSFGASKRLTRTKVRYLASRAIDAPASRGGAAQEGTTA
jgi:hypothetical protein